MSLADTKGTGVFIPGPLPPPAGSPFCNQVAEKMSRRSAKYNRVSRPKVQEPDWPVNNDLECDNMQGGIPEGLAGSADITLDGCSSASLHSNPGVLSERSSSQESDATITSSGTLPTSLPRQENVSKANSHGQPQRRYHSVQRSFSCHGALTGPMRCSNRGQTIESPYLASDALSAQHEHPVAAKRVYDHHYHHSQQQQQQCSQRLQPHPQPSIMSIQLPALHMFTSEFLELCSRCNNGCSCSACVYCRIHLHTAAEAAAAAAATAQAAQGPVRRSIPAMPVQYYAPTHILKHQH